jgi:acetyl esterase/lipase
MNRFLIASSALVLSLLAACHMASAPAGGAAGSALAAGPAGVPRIKLYATTPNIVPGPETEENPTEPTLDLYLPPADQATGAAVLVLPGGGYSNLAMGHEGAQVGQFFQSHHVAGFVLRYRHGPRYHYPTTLLDAQRAMRVLRARAAEFHVDPAKLGILGFSAGGHLAAMTTTLYDNKLLPDAPYAPDLTDALSAKPAFALLLYPVIDLTDDNVTHRGSRNNLTQNNPALYAPLSPQLHVTRDTPPVFLVHGTNDPAVPVMNSILFYEACVKARVPAEMHILENAPHGFGMGLNQNIEELKEWPGQALRFMARHKWIPAP